LELGHQGADSVTQLNKYDVDMLPHCSCRYSDDTTAAVTAAAHPNHVRSSNWRTAYCVLLLLCRCTKPFSIQSGEKSLTACTQKVAQAQEVFCITASQQQPLAGNLDLFANMALWCSLLYLCRTQHPAPH
jgi:hypothetical protein